MRVDPAELEALHARQNDAVLVMTVHVQVNPTRLSFLGADGELKTYTAETPSPQRVIPAGFDDVAMGAIGR